MRPSARAGTAETKADMHIDCSLKPRRGTLSASARTASVGRVDTLAGTAPAKASVYCWHFTVPFNSQTCSAKIMVSDISAQCGFLLAAGLQSSVLLPSSDAYKERQASYWAANALLRPSCIVQPQTTEEVSRVLKVLADIDGLVAVRSGGHTQWTGSNDIHDGITIDLGRMTNVTYDAHSKLALIQPGGPWVDVYQELLKYRVCVTGGRDGNVGVGGFLTGGGNSYYAGLYGLGCDNIANFEVVLADGEIINANEASHSDLWTALRGGSGNFGIVTRFDMYTFPAQDLWGGV